MGEAGTYYRVPNIFTLLTNMGALSEFLAPQSDFFQALENYWMTHQDPKGPRVGTIVKLNPLKKSWLPRPIEITNDMLPWYGRVMGYEARSGGYRVQEWNN